MRPEDQSGARRSGSRRGQAMVESCLVIVFLCLLFLGLFQFLHANVAREILYHAAACAARARAVGLNQWMVEKTMRVAAIPDAGTLTQPVLDLTDHSLVNALATKGPGRLWDFALRSTSQTPTLAIELARLPFYLDSANNPDADEALNYDRWDSITLVASPIANNANSLTALVQMPHGLLAGLDSLAEGRLDSSDTSTNLQLSASYTIEAHYPLYLNDMNW